MSNADTLDALFDQGAIALRRSPLFDEAPGPLPSTFDFDRIEGMMLGLAIGDALGRPTEGRVPARRRQTHGEVCDYVAGRRAPGGVGLPSDDTQMAFWTLECLNRDRGFVPEHVARRFCAGSIFGMGQTVSLFRRNFKAGEPWTRCGPASAGNGALMRIAPMLIPHLRSGTEALWVDAALSAMMTHNDSSSIASCLAFVHLLRQVLEMDQPPEPRWWIQTWIDLTRPLEIHRGYRPRGGQFEGFEGALWEFVEARVLPACDDGQPAVQWCDAWYSGAYLLETVPSVLLLLARHGHDPEEAIVRAVNDTKDNDTVGAIVGAAVGALHGRRALPARWIEGLSGRTTRDDDGRVFELIAEARAIWWPEAPTSGR